MNAIESIERDIIFLNEIPIGVTQTTFSAVKIGKNFLAQGESFGKTIQQFNHRICLRFESFEFDE